jgi:hypothetical protein
MKQTRAAVRQRRETRQKQADNGASIQFGVVAPHARHGSLVDIGVVAAPFAAMALTGGTPGAKYGGGEAGRFGSRSLHQPLRPFGVAQISQRLNQMPLQRAQPGGRRRLQRVIQ